MRALARPMTCCINAVNKTFSTAYNNAEKIVSQTLEDIKQAGTFKSERIISGKQASNISVQGTERRILNFCANNYLGLSVCILYVECL